ncbi:VOC family protein [Zavarzinia sp. CC-PAN008]|uniref:VOC family protein n=1 Tax=Zavarzinia sp. CC-PAN008 TaxID=3243332 RepID=UPI003F74AB34
MNHDPIQKQVAVITLGVADLDRARGFYSKGFGWEPSFINDQIAFYQMNGFVLGLFLTPSLEADMNRPAVARRGAYALAHNVRRREEVAPLLDRLVRAGGGLLRAADEPAHGGYRGYVADPDDHAWEIAWNPDWPIDADGHVRFAAPGAA